MERGQFWYNDFMLAFSILAVIGLIFVASMIDISSRDVLYDEAVSISSSLMSKGYNPGEWSQLDGRVGIVEGSKVNIENLQSFYSLTQGTNPEEEFISTVKPLLGVNNDFAFYFEDKMGSVVSEFSYDFGDGYFGHPSFSGISSLDADNVLFFIRFVYLDADSDGKGEIVKMVVAIWS